MRNLYKLLVVSILLSCNAKMANTSKSSMQMKIKISTIKSDFEKKSTYQIDLPRGSKRNKVYTQNGEVEMDYRFSYPDGSKFYISNDVFHGSPLNMENLYNIGERGYNKRANDTLMFEGVQKNNKYWKEHMLGYIVVGYIDASSTKKIEFDKAINSIVELDK